MQKKKKIMLISLFWLQVSSIDMLIHVTSCRKTFSQKQVCLVWNFIAEKPPAKKQVFTLRIFFVLFLNMPCLPISVIFEFHLLHYSTRACQQLFRSYSITYFFKVFFAHGLVTLNQDGAKVHNKLDAMDLLR